MLRCLIPLSQTFTDTTLYLQSLIIQVEDLQQNLTDEKLHLEREQETTKVYQSKHSDVQDKLKKMEEEIVSFSKHHSIRPVY